MVFSTVYVVVLEQLVVPKNNIFFCFAACHKHLQIIYKHRLSRSFANTYFPDHLQTPIFQIICKHPLSRSFTNTHFLDHFLIVTMRLDIPYCKIFMNTIQNLYLTFSSMIFFLALIFCLFNF